VFLIQIFFYGASALWGALLNTRRRFFAPAWAPILSNIAIIISLVLAKMQLKSGEDGFVKALHNAGFRYTLATGATVGIALQALVLLPAMRSAGIRFRFRADFRHPAVRQVFRLSTWTVGFAAANIVSAQIVQNLAKPGSGNASAYTLAYTFFQLPHALLAMSILTTFIPDLAGSVKRRDRFAFVDRMSFGIRTIALITVPAGFALFALRRPLVGALLQHGRFNALDSLVTSRALAGFALGLGGFSVYMFVLRGFYSHQDTKTPFKLNLIENALNIVFALVFVGPYGVLGLGLAFALAYILTALLAIQVLHYKVRGFELRPMFASMAKTVLASIVMAEAIWLFSKLVGSNAGLGAIARLLVGSAVGLPVYAGLMWLMGSPELRLVERMVLRRLRR
jgi:putative peptidoglycan lipid II flippase